MGYWDRHPMAGDTPMDVVYALDDLLFTEEEQKNNLHFNENMYKKRLEEKLAEAIEIDYYEDHDFVLPFKIAELGICIKDKELSDKVKNMIGDGGADYRGYELKESNSTNSYNEFQSPYDFARCLYDNWDKGMQGLMDLKNIGKSVGLFDKIFLEMNNGHNGLINKK